MVRKRKKRLIAPGLRDLFIPKSGLYLIEADYSQLEARILALISGDRQLLAWYADNLDVHTITGAILFQISEKELSKSQRDLSKRARYAWSYGSAIKKAWSALIVDYPSLGITDVERLFRKLAKLHPDIAVWQRAQIKLARQNDYIECPLNGRRRYCFGQVEPAKCYNLPIQMSAAHIINRAMIRIDPQLDWERESILFQVHDSLVIETFRPLEIYEILKREMELPIQCGNAISKFPVDFKVGVNWGEAREVDTYGEFKRELRSLGYRRAKR